MPPEHPPPLDDTFVAALLEALASLERGDFDARLVRTGQHGTAATIAHCFDRVAAELGERFTPTSSIATRPRC